MMPDPVSLEIPWEWREREVGLCGSLPRWMMLKQAVTEEYSHLHSWPRDKASQHQVDGQRVGPAGVP